MVLEPIPFLVPQDNNEWTLSGEVEGRIKQLRQDIIVVSLLLFRKAESEADHRSRYSEAGKQDPTSEMGFRLTGITLKKGSRFGCCYSKSLSL